MVLLLWVYLNCIDMQAYAVSAIIANYQDVVERTSIYPYVNPVWRSGSYYAEALIVREKDERPKYSTLVRPAGVFQCPDPAVSRIVDDILGCDGLLHFVCPVTPSFRRLEVSD